MIRNFLHAIRNFKLAYGLNILGLAISLAACMLIFMQVRYDSGFDRCYKDADEICRLDCQLDASTYALCFQPLARAFSESSPEVLSSGIMDLLANGGYWYVENNGQKETCNLSSWDISPGILDVFSFDMIEGGVSALDAPNSAIIPESLAHRLFGSDSALGRTLTSDDNDSMYTITGVYADFPENASLTNVMYTPFDMQQYYDDWESLNVYAFVKLAPNADKDAVMESFMNEFFRTSAAADDMEGLQCYLHSLPDLHFDSSVEFDFFPKTTRSTIYALISIALAILIIAGINFNNFCVSLAPMRIKSINTRKVLGSSSASLRCSLVAESIINTAIAFLISVLMVHLVGHSEISSLIDGNISLGENIPIVVGVAIVAVLLGAVIGLYPAVFMTSLPPSLVLKGSFGLSPSGKKVRNALVGVQFTASFVLIIVASFIFLQNRYMVNSAGFDKECILSVNTSKKLNKAMDSFTEEVMKIPGVEEVAFAESPLGSKDYYMTWGRDHKDGSIMFACLPVSYNYLKTMGIEVTDGRDFRIEDQGQYKEFFIFNEAAKAKYEMTAGDRVSSDGEVVGFVPDVKFASMRQEVTPMAFYIFNNYWTVQEEAKAAIIRVAAGSDMARIRNEIDACLDRIDPEYPYQISFYDEIIERNYQNERRTGSLVGIFSLAAVLISIVGVYSLVLFECGYRRKETAVKRVFGATAGSIIKMFNSRYMAILVICFIIGVPLARVIIGRWIEGFAYRIPLHWWVYLLSFAVVVIITVLTVTLQSWHIANENPVKNLRSE